jgi:apolipoprotein N-acyltransferase
VLTTFGGLPLSLAVPALLLLSVYMGIYIGLFSYGFFLLLNRGPLLLYLFAVPAAWVGLDWFRSWIISGFPWMDLGYGFWSVPALLQVADLFGHYGYTFLIVLVNGVILTFLLSRFTAKERAAGVVVTVMIIVAGFLYSRDRWFDILRAIDDAPTSVIGIVQGNVEQGLKWSPEKRVLTVDTYVNLSRQLVEKSEPSLIVWPETALPFYPQGNELLTPVLDFVAGSKTPLLTGAPWYEVIDWDRRVVNYFNSALLISESGEIGGKYYKSHLVPYGEYVPLKKYMPFLAPLVEAAGDFTPGRIEKPITSRKIKAGVLICYESIFEKIGRAWVINDANVFINLTNDAWYGKSSAPYQSWAMTIFRSVEARRSLVRSANTGISGVVDPLGRVRSQSPLFESWTDAAEVPLLTEQTIFVRGGFLFGPICAGIGIGSCFWARRRMDTGA